PIMSFTFSMKLSSLALPSLALLVCVGCAAPSTEAEALSSQADQLGALAAPIDLAKVDGEVLDLKTDAMSVYGLIRQTNTYLVQRFSKITGDATTLLTTTASSVSGFTMDEARVYLLRDDTLDTASIISASKLGGPMTVIAHNVPQRSYGLEADAT